MKNDKQLQQDILDELRWDPSIDSSKIEVFSEKGIVVLSGQVPKYPDKITAETIAKRVLGVIDITNDLTVTLPVEFERADADILETASNALKWDVLVSKNRIRVIVQEGILTLEGEVNWNYERSAAHHAVRNIIGIRNVINAIQVEPIATVMTIKRKIKEALRRTAEYDDSQIEVNILDGNVLLRGKVKAYTEKEAAELEAWNAPGIWQVENDITVRP